MDFYWFIKFQNQGKLSTFFLMLKIYSKIQVSGRAGPSGHHVQILVELEHKQEKETVIMMEREKSVKDLELKRKLVLTSAIVLL